MEIKQEDYEKLGAFYLGREYDLKNSELRDDLVLYDSKDLVTHGVVLGMTGSGKTGLCIGLLEEAAMDNIPAIVIDPKGDISNLMLNFPEFRGSDFEPWVNQDDARKKGRSVGEHAEKTAQMWKEGIESWGQSADRLREFQRRVDVNIFTPGSSAGIPVSILSSLDVPPFEVMDDAELLGDRVESTVSSLLSFVGLNVDPLSPEAVLLSSIFQHEWHAGRGMSIESIIRCIQKPDFDKIGVIDLESFYPSSKRQALAMKFNSLLASPSFGVWLEGAPLDIQSMLYHQDGRARVSIFSISHLNDSERMFFVSILLNQMLAWMRRQSGTTSLRALLYMDEIYGYLPPTANPPSKKPMMTMLKQARAFGLGVLLATQNPVDLDYKALSNIGTWWLGRLQTERDKMRVLDGLEGAAASQDGKFDRQAMEQLLAGLGSRVFLMNNVHENAPVVFQVRWVMSYLRGPLTKGQIKTLMDPKRDGFEQKKANTADASSSSPMSMPSAKTEPAGGARPAVGKGVEELFVPTVGDAHGLIYQPHLLRHAEVFFSDKKTSVEATKKLVYVNAMQKNGINWEDSLNVNIPMKEWSDKPQSEIGYGDLPGYAMNGDNYKGVEDDLEEWIYRNYRIEVFHAPVVDTYSTVDETEGEFRARLALSAREMRDAEIEKLRESVEKKIEREQDKLERAYQVLEREKAQASSAKMQAGVKIVESVLGMFLGRKKVSATNIRRGRSTITSAGRAYQQGADVKIAEKKIEDIEYDIQELQRELEEEMSELSESFDPMQLALEKIEVKPYKKDISIKNCSLLWVAA